MRAEEELMKKYFTALLSVFLVLCLVIPVQVHADTAEEPTRVIHLVYDDSGSMYDSDIWCQAKYAIEVFAAMLGEKDLMDVYYLNQSAGSASLRLNGKDGVANNVEKVHTSSNGSGNTEFYAVTKALEDLTTVTADEKWLVVLTDGAFDWSKDEVEEHFAAKPDDVNVMYLGMGQAARGITENAEKNIYYFHAKSSKDILSEITEICTRIFNYNRLEVDMSTKKISYDVPMKELKVFAQGAEVQINGIQKSDGTPLQRTMEPVGVRYREESAPGPIDRNLVGSIATYMGDYDAGEYTLDVTGAETIEVYYKPNIEVAAYLKDSDGNEISDLSSIEAGEYIIEFGFVKAGTTEAVPTSKLLGNVTYEATVYNAGQEHEKKYSSGDHIVITKGDLVIDVSANYLQYHTVSTKLNYSVYADKEITFTIVENPEYVVTSEGIETQKPVIVKALLHGKEFTSEEWTEMGTPVGDIISETKFAMGELIIEKQDEIGIFYIFPTLGDTKPSDGTYDDCDYSFRYVGQHGNGSWYGGGELTLQLRDDRSWFEQNQELFKRIVVFSIIFLFFLGYVPGVKKYLPKMVSEPTIKGEPISAESMSDGEKKFSGRYAKKMLWTILPYVPEQGNICFCPRGVRGIPEMEVVAAGGGMRITNLKNYENHENIKVGSKPLYKQEGVVVISKIKIDTETYEYTCFLNK